MANVENLKYAYSDETMKLLPHHTDVVSEGHSHKSVDMDALKKAITDLSLCEGLGHVVTDRATAHLLNHAKWFGVDEAESIDDKGHRIRVSFYKHLSGTEFDTSVYIADIYEDSVIGEGNGAYYKYALTENPDGTFSFGDPERVVKQYMPVVTEEADIVEEADVVPEVIDSTLMKIVLHLDSIEKKLASVETSKVATPTEAVAVVVDEVPPTNAE